MQRYAITHLGKDGLRKLTFANQGRNHYDSKQKAQEAMEALEPELRGKILGDMANTLEVREVECYDHGDAKGIYFDIDLQPVTGKPFSAVCVSCLRSLNAGDGAEKYEHGTVYADTFGTPWKAYYCTPCASAALTLQEVRRG